MTEAGKSPSRATVAPPKRTQQTSFLGNQIKPVGAADNMEKEKNFMLSFSVPVSWHKQFKMTAANSDMKMVELLFESFKAWQEKNQK